MSAPDAVTAVVLAAGAGRRLGGCKALLDLGGATALERVLATLDGAGVRDVRVVLGHEADAVRVRHDLAGRAVVENPAPERGMTSSLRAGLAAPLDAPAWLLHTVDHPLVAAATLEALLAAWRARPEGTSIVAPSRDGRRGHPVVFDAALAGEFLALGDDEPAHRVVRRDPTRVQHVRVEDPWVLRDLDTPDDLAAAREALRGLDA